MLALIEAARAGDLGRREVRDQVDAARSETDAQVKKMLGEEDFAEYLEARPGPPRGGGRGGPR